MKTYKLFNLMVETDGAQGPVDQLTNKLKILDANTSDYTVPEVIEVFHNLAIETSAGSFVNLPRAKDLKHAFGQGVNALCWVYQSVNGQWVLASFELCQVKLDSEVPHVPREGRTMPSFQQLNPTKPVVN